MTLQNRLAKNRLKSRPVQSVLLMKTRLYGDPMKPLSWTTLSAEKIAGVLEEEYGMGSDTCSFVFVLSFVANTCPADGSQQQPH